VASATGLAFNAILSLAKHFALAGALALSGHRLFRHIATGAFPLARRGDGITTRQQHHGNTRKRRNKRPLHHRPPLNRKNPGLISTGSNFTDEL